MRRGLAFTVLLVGVALLLQQGYLLQPSDGPARPVPAFRDVSQQAGITHNRVPSLDMAAGQAWGDYDRDGWADLYVTDPDGPNTLYRNNRDGTFGLSPLSEQVALPEAYSGGATFADYDNDGWLDLIVVNWGADNLFHNEGGQGFTDVTQQAGIADNGNSKSASWGDFDRDGFLDLYIANWSCYPQCGRQMDGDPDRLYHNNRDGTFTDVSDYLGGSLNGAGFIASFVDYDNDGDPDIYLVNDEFINPIGNKLWRNDGPGCKGWCFTQVAHEAGADSKLFGMGLAVGDYDNNGTFDLYYSNVGPMELLSNQGDGTFVEVAEQAGVQAPESIGWASLFLDYDNDGWRDLYLAVSDTTDHKDIASNKLFRNNADGTFSEAACNNEAADVRPSLGAASADYDRDGWVDLVIGNMDEGYRLYRNETGSNSGNHWLALELIGAGPVNRDAVGTRLTLSTPGGPTQMQEVINGSGMGGGSELALYFGLGPARTANLTIRWPDGTTQKIENVAADQRYRLDYPLEGPTSLQVLPKMQPPRVQSLIIPEGGLTLDSRSQNTEFPISILLVLGLVLTGLALLALSTPPKQPRIETAFLSAAALAGLYLFTSGAAGMPAWRLFSPDARLQALMQQADVHPPTNPSAPAPALVELGEALFWDPILSGNRDVACATCHHPLAGTGDNLSVSIGTGGLGLAEKRIQPDDERDFIPRNANPLFNLGYLEWTTLFWDGRVSRSASTSLNAGPQSGFDTPASDRLLPGLDNLLAAQSMFPVTSRDEMRGLRGDADIFGQPNELAAILDYTSRPIWDGLMQRMLAIPAYVELFRAAYPDIPPDSLTFAQAANAIAAYEMTAFTFEDSPFDRYLQGDRQALPPDAKRGALLFYGEAGCAECHSGPLLTDQQFYNLAVPQIGDGKGREQPFDLGRARETGNACDRYAFRTPPLRNVALTGPWMHNGSLTTLEAVIRHHLDPAESLKAYDPAQLAPALQDTCQDQPEVLASVLATVSSSKTEGARLSERDIQDLLAFLEALTSPSALHLENTIPASVPSGLPVGGNVQPPNPQVNQP